MMSKIPWRANNPPYVGQVFSCYPIPMHQRFTDCFFACHLEHSKLDIDLRDEHSLPSKQEVRVMYRICQHYVINLSGTAIKAAVK